MSIATLKKKSMYQYGKNHSGKQSGPGEYWVTQGPFGNSSKNVINSSNVGFSLNGAHRNVGYIGKTYQMSKNGTPFKGNYPVGHGGSGGKYNTSNQVYIARQFNITGSDYQYIKPSTLSTKGMLSKKYKWIHSGQYPNNWVQPNYGTSMLADTKSQGNYIDNLAVSNLCVSDVNNVDKYKGYVRIGGPTLCKTSAAGFKYNDMARNGLYCKFINQAQDCSTHTREIKRNCQNVTDAQKPFPFATNGNACNAVYYTSPPTPAPAPA